MYIAFLDNAFALNRLQYSANVTFIYTGKPKYSCGSLYCNIHFIMVVWNQTHNISEVCLYHTVFHQPPQKTEAQDPQSPLQ